MEYMKKAGSIIRQYRAKHKITQDEFAKLAGISDRSVSQIETEKFVRDSTLESALKVTGFDLEVNRIIKPSRS